MISSPPRPRIGPAVGVLIAFAIYAAQVVYSTWWMSKFRFGPAEWLQPYTDETVRGFAESGVKRMAVVAPGFSADCLETLEELNVENRHIFTEHGGEDFAYLPCLNDGEEGMRVIQSIVARELRGWIDV